MPTLKEVLGRKLDSEAKYRDALQEATGSGDIARPSSSCFHHSLVEWQGNHLYETSWWFSREALRLTSGVYGVSSVIAMLNQSFTGPMCLHIATEDKTKVAYTASIEDGAADRQVRTSLGKFLRKHFLLLTDTHIQRLESAHRAEVNAEILYAHTPEEIKRVYTEMRGDSGCMRYSSDHFNIGNGLHPSAVYSGPGLGVAYVEYEGVIKARSVVYENPADPTDKRYVRVYGDQVIKTMLEREGYVLGDLNGAELAAHPHVPAVGEAAPHTYLMPYLDAPGGGRTSSDAAYVINDAGTLRVVDALTVRKMQNRWPGKEFAVHARTQCGAVRIRPTPKIEFTSDLTGIVYRTLDIEQVLCVGADGVVKNAVRSEIVDDGRWTLLHTRVDGRTVGVWATSDAPRFDYEYDTWLENDANRRATGHTKLSPRFYPTRTDWTRGIALEVESNGELHIVLEVDIVHTLGPEEGSYAACRHVSEVEGLRAAGYVNGPDGAKFLIHKDRPTFRRTLTGIGFDTEHHADRFVELYTGECVKTGAARRVRSMGVTTWVDRATGWDPANYCPTLPVYQYAWAQSATVKSTADFIAALQSAGTGVSPAAVETVLGSIKSSIQLMISDEVGEFFAADDDNEFGVRQVPGHSRIRELHAVADLIGSDEDAFEATHVTFSRCVRAVYPWYEKTEAQLIALQQRLEAEAEGQRTIETA